MVAGEMESADAGRDGFDLINTVEHIVESSADNDVLIKRGMGNEGGVRVNGKGKTLVFPPIRNDFKEGNIAFKGGGANSADSGTVEIRSDGAVMPPSTQATTSIGAAIITQMTASIRVTTQMTSPRSSAATGMKTACITQLSLPNHRPIATLRAPQAKGTLITKESETTPPAWRKRSIVKAKRKMAAYNKTMTPLVISDAFRTPFLMAGSGGGMNGGGCGRRGDMVDGAPLWGLKILGDWIFSDELIFCFRSNGQRFDLCVNGLPEFSSRVTQVEFLLQADPELGAGSKVAAEAQGGV